MINKEEKKAEKEVKTTSDNVVTVTGNKIGEGELKIKANGTTTSIPVNVVAEKAQKDGFRFRRLSDQHGVDEQNGWDWQYPEHASRCRKQSKRAGRYDR